MISRKAEASKAVSDLEQQLAEKRRWEASRDDAAKTKRDCEKREKDIKADAPQRKAALDKARRDQDSSPNYLISFIAFLSCLSLYCLKNERRASNHL